MIKNTSQQRLSQKQPAEGDPRKILNEALKVFFMDAVKTTLRHPLQALHFLRVVRWQMKAARIRSFWSKENIPVPPILIFSITNKCNLECQGCYQKAFHPESEQELSADKLKEITHEAYRLGIYFFVIAGGEPLLRPEMLQITRAYPEIIFLIFTNGSMMDEAMVKQFRRQRNVVPLISLEGDAVDTDQRRGEGTYAHVLKIMRQLRKHNVFFGTSITLTCHNFAKATDAEFIRELTDAGCKFFLYLDYTPIQAETQTWVLTDEQREEVSDLMRSFRRQFSALFIGVPWDEDDVGGCLSAGRGFVHINAEGHVEPCPFAPISDSNLKEKSLKEALQSNFLKKLREVPELSTYTGEGCALWKNRDRVQALLTE